MKYTTFQKKVMNYLGLAKVSYDNIWTRAHQLGYVTPDSPFDKIHIAKDFPDRDVKYIALLHECGHVYFNHTSVDSKEEIKRIKEIFTECGKDFSMIMMYGGPMNLLNIAMDLVVNSKLLTLANVKHINQFVTICTPESYNLPVYDDFRDYYKPLIERLPDGKMQISQMSISISQQGQSGNKSNNKSSGSGNGKNSDNNSGDNGNSLPKLTEGLEDIMKGVSGFDKDLDEDIKKALREEGYRSGDSKDSKSNGNEEESTVENEVDQADIEADTSINERTNSSKNIGSGHSIRGNITIKENSSAEIKNFLSKILKPSMVYLPDSMKHYNRGTRPNSSGILYNSIRRRNKMDKKTLGVLIDCSGSMNSESIITALSSLKSSLDVVSKDSLVAVWDTSLCAEFPITKIPSSVPCGGGTDMASGLKYLVNKKNCTEVVVYSDMWTDIKPMTKLIKEKNINVYTIEAIDNENNRVSNSRDSESKNWEEYYKANRDYIVVKNINK